MGPVLTKFYSAPIDKFLSSLTNLTENVGENGRDSLWHPPPALQLVLHKIGMLEDKHYPNPEVPNLLYLAATLN